MAMIDKDGVILQPELNLHPSVLKPVLNLRTTVLGFEDDDLMATTNNDGGIFNGTGVCRLAVPEPSEFELLDLTGNPSRGDISSGTSSGRSSRSAAATVWPDGRAAEVCVILES